MDKNNSKSKIHYIQVKSFVDSSFFSKLGDLKLNKYKLDESRKKITGFSTHPLYLTKFNDFPTINFDDQSFSEDDLGTQLNISWNASVYNLNTIEDFKNKDKKVLLNEWAKEIFDDITAKTDNLSIPRSFNKAFLIVFSDLKKYKFYYWMAMPTLSSSWTIINHCDNDLTSVDIMITKYLEGSTSFHQFFQIQNDSIIVKPSMFLSGEKFVFIDSCNSSSNDPSVELKNYLFFLAAKGFTRINLLIFRKSGSFMWDLQFTGSKEDLASLPTVTGWERTGNGKLGAKLADLGSLIDPKSLARQAVDLNLKLMKWRISPDLDLEVIKPQKVLLLGAGTLGSYVSRALMGWGIKNITFVDNGRISYSNPVRQPLFAFKDCFSDNGAGEWKAIQAAKSLKEVFPDMITKGFNIEVPMIGHYTTEEKERLNFTQLYDLFMLHDAIFLLMDSRESRWLPTVLGTFLNKTVINAALGFDSFVVMRHGCYSENSTILKPGCYYCNDVVAPLDSLSDRTLDQMCTVTRPGAAPLASALAVELYVSILQHPLKQFAPPDTKHSTLGCVPHQIRGSLHDFSQNTFTCPSYSHCSACSDIVCRKFEMHGWDFLKKCLQDPKYLESICGLDQIQKEAELASEELLSSLTIDEDDEFDEWLK